MAKKQSSNVDAWLKRESAPVRKTLERASSYFDGGDSLTVNTLEAVYGQESSFGRLSFMRESGSAKAAGHFHLEPATAKRYGLSVSKKNDQRFDIDYASSAAARYLKDLNTLFSKGIKDVGERKKFVLAAYNASEFSKKSPANKTIKQRESRKGKHRCTEGHWRTIDDRRVFICD